VQKSLASGPMFIEGSVTHLRIVQRDGSKIVDELRPVDTLDVPILDRELPAGSYRLAAVERPCAANCQNLDPPAEDTRCEIEFDVHPSQTTFVAVVLRTGAPTKCSTTMGQ